MVFEQPSYQAESPEGIVSSARLADLLEVPGVDLEPDPRAIDCLLSLEYIPAPLTIFKGIWKPPYGPGPVADTPLPASTREIAGRLKELLIESVRACVGGGEPPGVWLSGGLDSSSIVAAMAELGVSPIRTFSVGFYEESYDELLFARLVAERFETKHEEIVLDGVSPEMVRRVVAGLDEPLGDLGLISTFAAAELASGDVRIVLSGEGADELLGGYDCHVAAKVDRFYRLFPGWVRHSLVPGLLGILRPSFKKRGLINSAKRFVEGASLPAGMGHVRWRMHLAAGGTDALYGPGLRAGLDGWNPLSGLGSRGLSHDDFEPALAADLESYLPGSMLAKAVSAARANSLEVRFPFLDDEFAKFAVGVPSRLKLRGFTRKYILKEAMRDMLPSVVVDRGKEGFSVPMKHWLREGLRPLMEDVLSEKRVKSRGLFEPAAVARLVSEHLSKRKNHSHTLWALMVLELWLERFLPRPLPRTDG
jgi:asparagine synthase (glutamine-hydrolysing)